MLIHKQRKNVRKILPLSVSLVVPVYNGSDIIISQLKSCKKILNSISDKFEIIVCDDNSGDNTSYLLKKAYMRDKAFRLFFNKKNLGISKNLKKIYSLAKYEYIVLFSADGDWDPIDVGKMIQIAYVDRADIVIGKRNRSGYNLYRKIISYSYNILPRLFFGVDTIDAGSIKVIRKNLLHQTSLYSSSIFFEAELIIKAIKSGRKVSSVPIHFKRIKKKMKYGGKILLASQCFRDLISLKFIGI